MPESLLAIFVGTSVYLHLSLELSVARGLRLIANDRMTRTRCEASTQCRCALFSVYRSHSPLFPTPGAPMTATFTSHNELFFLRIPLIAFDVMIRAFGTAIK